MIEVEMSKDIRECEPKLIGPFTKRQIVCLIIAFAYGVPLYLLFKGIENITLRIFVTIALMSPAIACGWMELYGFHLEQFVVYIFKTRFLRPKKRKAEAPNLYEEIKDEIEAEEEAENIKSKALEKIKQRSREK